MKYIFNNIIYIAGPLFEKFFFTTNGEIVFIDCITEYLYMTITFQGVIGN